MDRSSHPSRRGFLAGTAVGLAAAGPLGWFAGRHLHLPRFSGPPAVERPAAIGMPGRYERRVVRVHDPKSVKPDHTFDAERVRLMVHRGIVDLVGGDPKDPASAWKKFFEKGDVVGIKVNPVGRAPQADDTGRVHGAVGSISSPEVIFAVAEGLKWAGVPTTDLILFDRYADELFKVYKDTMKSDALKGARWLASSDEYTDTQLDIEGFDSGRERAPHERARHVVGYDPDVFAHMGFCAPEHSVKDDRRFRSHLSVIVTRMINKLITIPCLKDHRSAGVTLSLKNMSHGMNNNVARSHIGRVEYGFGDVSFIGPNQCNTFIPHAVAQKPLIEKATLHVLDGLIGVYEGGPGCWNPTWGTWHAASLFFATDPVAMDHVGWDIIDRKRAEVGWAPVARTGLAQHTLSATTASELAALGGRSPLDAAALGVGAKHLRDGRPGEAFDLRTPQHIRLAGGLGLGEFRAAHIDYRSVVL